MGKFHQFLTELSARNRSVLSFPDDYFSKYKLIFTKFGVCIDIVEICFGIADGQILSIFYRELSAAFCGIRSGPTLFSQE